MAPCHHRALKLCSNPLGLLLLPRGRNGTQCPDFLSPALSAGKCFLLVWASLSVLIHKNFRANIGIIPNCPGRIWISSTYRPQGRIARDGLSGALGLTNWWSPLSGGCTRCMCILHVTVTEAQFSTSEVCRHSVTGAVGRAERVLKLEARWGSWKSGKWQGCAADLISAGRRPLDC